MYNRNKNYQSTKFQQGFRGGIRKTGGRRSFKPTFNLAKLINKATIVEEAEVYLAQHKFTDFKIDERLKKNIIDKGYEIPTPIQDKIINYILNGQDVVGMANTGTGKTAAFAIPLLDKATKNHKEKTLIMAPTRELAIQIEAELKSFSSGLGIQTVVCVGGAPIGCQISALHRPHHFVIGTPGRLKDLIDRRALNLADTGTVVLDEADRMLDMGFVHDMRYILNLMKAKRHTLFFWPPYRKR